MQKKKTTSKEKSRQRRKRLNGKSRFFGFLKLIEF